MNKFAIAAAALVALSGAAIAQEAPALIYSDTFAQNVQNVGGASFSGRASATQAVDAGVSYDVHANQDYSGR